MVTKLVYLEGNRKLTMQAYINPIRCNGVRALPRAAGERETELQGVVLMQQCGETGKPRFPRMALRETST